MIIHSADGGCSYFWVREQAFSDYPTVTHHMDHFRVTHLNVGQLSPEITERPQNLVTTTKTETI
jgi:hypothetical protein